MFFVSSVHYRCMSVSFPLLFLQVSRMLTSMTLYSRALSYKKHGTEHHRVLQQCRLSYAPSEKFSQNLGYMSGEVEKSVKGLHVAIDWRKNNLSTGGGAAIQPE